MGKAIDLTGKRQGLLEVIERAGTDKRKNALWRCKCDCGNETIITSQVLKEGQKSCGCIVRSNLQGKRFGRLTAIRDTGERKNRRILWECICDCGNKVNADSTALLSGHTKSCGCLMRDTASKTFYKHGKATPRLYQVWKGMRARCNNPNHTAYHNYGGRGITVCGEWADYETFRKWAIDNGYDESAKQGDCTIDRINVNGNYEPSNCRWVDMKIQANNTRKLKAKGETE